MAVKFGAARVESIEQLIPVICLGFINGGGNVKVNAMYCL
jgi:hypothetical protein